MVHDDVPSVGTTALAFFIGVGSRDEEPREWGMAHLLEHLLFKGAGSLDYRAIARQMDRLGADINAFTTRDYTCFYAKVLDSEAERAYLLLREMVQQPWLRPEDLAKEKNVVLEEMHESLDDPDEVLDTLVSEALYEDPAYTHDILGTSASLADIDAESLRAFFDRHYQPQTMVFAASGGSAEKLAARVHEDFGGACGDSPRLPKRRQPPRFAPRRLVRLCEWEQCKLALAVPAPSRYDRRYASALMMASLLGGQNTSRLWQRLREEEGLVYTVATHYSPEDDFGDMVTYLGLAPQRVGEAWTAVQEEMASLAANGPQEEELEHTRVTLNTVLVMNQETPDARVMRLGRYGLEQRRAPALSAVADELGRVTMEDVRRQAQVWVDGGSQALAAAGPLEAADCVRMGIMNEELPS